MATQKVALVTGCTEEDGLGASLSKELCRRGWRVFATGRRLAAVAFLEKDGCETLELDITNKESVAVAAAKIGAEGGRLDLLINNAASFANGPLLDTDIEASRQLFEVNVYGTLRACQAFAPLLIETANREQHGHTVLMNIGSAAAIVGQPWLGIYNASKAANHAMSDTLRKEVRGLGVDVITVELAGIKGGSNLRGATQYTRTKPSGYYDWPALSAQTNKARYKAASEAHDMLHVARDIVNAAEAKTTPLKIWPGTPGWLFKTIFGLLPTWFVDKLMTDAHVAGLVKRPGA